MPRYIDADALICEICLKDCECTPEECGGKPCGEVKRIMDAPTISPDEVRGIGKWIVLEPEIDLRSCSVCEHMVIRADYNYCPNCGAKMIETKTEPTVLPTFDYNEYDVMR